ncbi:MAG: hypothetical protein R3D26_19730 [Cyanobacteriota/Melainabacteria group bacterium]
MISHHRSASIVEAAQSSVQLKELLGSLKQLRRFTFEIFGGAQRRPGGGR